MFDYIGEPVEVQEKHQWMNYENTRDLEEALVALSEGFCPVCRTAMKVADCSTTDFLWECDYASWKTSTLDSFRRDAEKVLAHRKQSAPIVPASPG